MKGKCKNITLWFITIMALVCFAMCAFAMETDVTVAKIVGAIVSAAWITLFCCVNEKKLTV